MKILSQEEILAILNRDTHPSIADEHLDAIYHEDRLKLHSETRLDFNRGQSRALNAFLYGIAQELLPPEKYKMFESLLTTPLPTVEVTDGAYNELYKVFFGQNRVVDYKFKENQEFLEMDWQAYRKAKGFDEWFRLEGWNIFKNHINSPIVIDLPKLEMDENGEFIMNTDRPEPFFFFVPTKNVIDQHNDHANNCHYLLYGHEASMEMNQEQLIDQIAYYVDSERYATYVRQQDIWKLAAETPHDLGYAPCRSFWNVPLRNSTYQRQNPITPNLGALDWMLFSMTSKRHLDLYAGFPIVSLYEQQCDYRNSDGFHCEGGFVQRYTNAQRTETSLEKCPQCSENTMIGVGSTITLPLPDPDAASNTNLMPGVNVTNGDVMSLKQMNDEIERQRREFMIHVTGFDNSESNQSPGKGDREILTFQESRHNKIMEVKMGFEEIEKFVMDTVAKLRYGKSLYLGSVINYGSRFFQKSEHEMQADYKSARENGMPSYELANMRQEIYKKKYANDPKILHRIQILDQLEPYPDYTVAQLQGLSIFVDPNDLALKVAFNDLIARFERENGPIGLFMPLMPMELRVELIRKELDSYMAQMELPYKQIAEQQEEEEEESNESQTNNNNGTNSSKQAVRQE